MKVKHFHKLNTDFSLQTDSMHVLRDALEGN